MGVTESKCVVLDNEEVYVAESYSVTRTSGATEDGWKLDKNVHPCYNQHPLAWKPRAHAFILEEGWKIHLHRGDAHDAEEHVCGWRRLGTFWPTRLTGDAAAIEAWTATFKSTLERCAAEQGLPSVYREHACMRYDGDGNQCSACFWEVKAKELAAKREELVALRKQLAEIESEQETATRHDEMAAWDAAWDELDKKIHALKTELKED
jgi:hypothetical protein